MKPMEEEKVKGEEPSEDAREEDEGVGVSSAPQVAANNHGTRVSRHTETNIIFTLLRTCCRVSAGPGWARDNFLASRLPGWIARPNFINTKKYVTFLKVRLGSVRINNLG